MISHLQQKDSDIAMPLIKDNKIPKYILFVGENGSGKTTFLRKLNSLPRMEYFDFVGINNYAFFSRSVGYNSILKTCSTFKLQYGRMTLDNAWSKLSKIDFVEANTQVRNDNAGTKSFLYAISSIEAKLKHLSREDEFTRDNKQNRIIYLREITKKWNQLLGTDFELNTKRISNTNTDKDTVISIYKDKTGRLEDLSGGELRALALAINIYMFGQSDNLISLIDEPETNLHPRMQLKFADFYTQTKENCQVFIATHSPFIIKSFLEKYPNDTLILHFYKKDGKYEISSISSNQVLSTTALAEINYHVFNIPSIEFHICLFDLFHKKIEKQLNKQLTITELDNEFKKIKIFTNAINQLQNKDDFSTDKTNLLKVGVFDKTGKRMNETLPIYIRNCIDHPKHGSFTDEELHQSCDILINLNIK